MGEGRIVMKYCFKCGNKLPDDARFCTKCGTPQEQQVEDKPVESNAVVAETHAVETAQPVTKKNVDTYIPLKNRIIWTSAAFAWLLINIIFSFLGALQLWTTILTDIYLVCAMVINIIGFVKSLIRKKPLPEIVTGGVFIFLVLLFMIACFIIAIG